MQTFRSLMKYRGANLQKRRIKKVKNIESGNRFHFAK